MARREIPVNFQEWATINAVPNPVRPETMLEALMRAAPGDEPAESLEELQPVREAVADCIDQLTAEQRFVIEAIQAERISYRDLHRRLGCSLGKAWNLHRDATRTLRTLLEAHPVIRRRLNMPNTWNNAVREAIADIDDLSRDYIVAETHGAIVNGIEIAKRRANSNLEDTGRIVTPMAMAAAAAARWLRHVEAWSIGDAVDLMCRKQHDYGHGNILSFGLFGVVVRASDKVARLENLMAKGLTPANESVEDTLRDIVGYGAIALMLERGTFTLDLADEDAPCEHEEAA